VSRPGLREDEFELLRRLVQKECGIAVGDEKAYLIETRLSSLVAESGCRSFREFYDLARTSAGKGLRDKIVDAMTTNETLWFRDQGPWKILRQELLPRWSQELQDGTRRRVRIWAAAASTGQEPYSVAISVLEHLRESAPPGVKEEAFEILGTDISPSALFMAVSGRYDGLSISRGLEPALRDRYFEASGRVWSLRERVKQRVSYRRFNLMDPFVPLGVFDLVLCRNVLIYFSNELKRDIVTRLAGRLEPGGRLVVGASESLQGCMQHYTLRQCEGHFFYEVKARKDS